MPPDTTPAAAPAVASTTAPSTAPSAPTSAPPTPADAPATQQAPGAEPAPSAPVLTPRQAERVRMREISRQVLGLSRPAPAATPGPAGSTPAPAAGEAPTQQAADTIGRIEQAGGDAPAQRTGETDRAYEQRLNNTLLALQRAEGEREQHRQRGDAAEARAAELDAQTKKLQSIIDGARGNVERALELAGVSPEEVAQMMLEGKLRRGRYANLPPEVRTRLEDLERKEAERERVEKERTEAEAKAKAQAEARAKDLAYVNEQMTTLGAEFALPVAMPNANERILSAVYATYASTGKEPDLKDVLADLTQHITADATALLSNERSAKALCSVPAVRDTLLRVLGVKPAPEQSPQASPASDDRGKQPTGGGPRSLSQTVVSEVPARTSAALSERERNERIRAAGRQVLRGA